MTVLSCQEAALSLDTLNIPSESCYDKFSLGLTYLQPTVQKAGPKQGWYPLRPRGYPQRS